MDFTIFRQRLSELMESHGYTMRQLSDDLGITAATLSRYLAGIRTPDLIYVVRIAAHFKVTVDWLIGLDDEKYELLSPDIRELIHDYSICTDDDRRVIQAVLKKYHN